MIHVLDGSLTTVMHFRAAPRWIQKLWFVDDDRRLIVSADAETRVWRIDAPGLLALADARAPRDLTAAERSRFAHLLDAE